MKIKYILTLAFILATTVIVKAQVVSKDSINTLKQEKGALELGQQLNERKLKLAKLENSVEKQSGDMQKAQEKVQKSADDNAEIAAKLSADASNKKMARKARKAARSTERYAKEARKEASNLESLQKDIDSLKKQIADDEAKLATMQPLPVAVSKN
ncbi:MAG: hypothetical protein ABUT20_23350 [Bacteroidota bacterium]